MEPEPLLKKEGTIVYRKEGTVVAEFLNNLWGLGTE
jgi:hypothetical protein